MKKSLLFFCLFWLGSLTLLSQEADFKDGTIGLSGKLSGDKSYLLVTDIYLGSPADLAGLKHGDEIIKINGTNVNQLSDLVNYANNITDPGLTFTVQRIGNPEPLIIKVPRLTVDLYRHSYFTEMELRSLCQIPVTLSEARMNAFLRSGVDLYSFDLSLLADSSKDFYQYKTFDFEYTSMDNPLMEKNIFAKLESQLTRMGLSRSTENPDLIITLDFKELASPRTQGVLIKLQLLEKKEIGKSKTPPIIWSGSLFKKGGNLNSIDELSGDLFKIMLFQYPYVWLRHANEFYYNWHYAYTGIIYSRDDPNIIADVVPGSPAEAAGIKKGDVILTINDYTIPKDLFVNKKYRYYHKSAINPDELKLSYYEISKNKSGGGLRYLYLYPEYPDSKVSVYPDKSKVLNVKIKRQNQVLTFSVTPEDKSSSFFRLD